MWYLAKALQLVGIVVVLNAVVAGIFWAATMNQELQLVLLGGVVFTFGYLLEPNRTKS